MCCREANEKHLEKILSSGQHFREKRHLKLFLALVAICSTEELLGQYGVGGLWNISKSFLNYGKYFKTRLHTRGIWKFLAWYIISVTN